MTELPFDTCLDKLRDKYIAEHCPFDDGHVLTFDESVEALMSNDAMVVYKALFSLRHLLVYEGYESATEGARGIFERLREGEMKGLQRILNVLESITLETRVLHEILLILLHSSGSAKRKFQLPTSFLNPLLAQLKHGDPIVVVQVIESLKSISSRDLCCAQTLVGNPDLVPMFTKIAHRFPLSDVFRAISSFLNLTVTKHSDLYDRDEIFDLFNYMLSFDDPSTFEEICSFLEKGRIWSESTKCLRIGYISHFCRALIVTEYGRDGYVASLLHTMAQGSPHDVIPELLRCSFIDGSLQRCNVDSNSRHRDLYDTIACLSFCVRENKEFANCLNKHSDVAAMLVRELSSTYFRSGGNNMRTRKNVHRCITDLLTVVGIPFMDALLNARIFEEVSVWRLTRHNVILKIVHTMLTITLKHADGRERLLKKMNENGLDKFCYAAYWGSKKPTYIAQDVLSMLPVANCRTGDEGGSKITECNTSADLPPLKKSNNTHEIVKDDRDDTTEMNNLTFETSLEETRENYIVEHCPFGEGDVLTLEDAMASIMSNDTMVLYRALFSLRYRLSEEANYCKPLHELKIFKDTLNDDAQNLNRVVELLTNRTLEKRLLHELLTVLTYVAGRTRKFPESFVDPLLSYLKHTNDPTIVEQVVQLFKFALRCDLSFFRENTNVSNVVALLTEVAHRLPLSDVFRAIITLIQCWCFTKLEGYTRDDVFHLMDYMLQFDGPNVFYFVGQYLISTDGCHREAEARYVRAYTRHFCRAFAIQERRFDDRIMMTVDNMARKYPKLVIPVLLSCFFIDTTLQRINLTDSDNSDFIMQTLRCWTHCASCCVEFATALFRQRNLAALFVTLLRRSYTYSRGFSHRRDQLHKCVKSLFEAIGVPFVAALINARFFESLPLCRKTDPIDYYVPLDILHSMLTLTAEQRDLQERVVRMAMNNGYDKYCQAHPYGTITERISAFFPRREHLSSSDSDSPEW